MFKPICILNNVKAAENEKSAEKLFKLICILNNVKAAENEKSAEKF